jgi:RHS repeat-associated protein
MNETASSLRRLDVFRCPAFLAFLFCAASVFATTLDNPESQDPCPPLVPSFGEATGMRFRRVGIDGLLLPDAKGQAKPETDQGNEETYVDSLTLQLRHDTSDIYAPLSGGELSLAVKRSIAGEVWAHDPKGYYGENPSAHFDAISGAYVDRPFGFGWTSGIGAALRVESYTFEDNCCSAPPRAYVLANDEGGASYRFMRIPGVVSATSADEANKPIFLPVPGNRTEVSAFFNKLIAFPATSPATGIEKFVLTRKYGTKVTYAGSPAVSITVQLDADGNRTKTISYFRLSKIEDRFGNTLTYTYPSGDTRTLIPERITASTSGSSTTRYIDIAKNSDGTISSVTDPRGKTWSYSYTPRSVDGYSLPTLTSVSGPGGVARTDYTYESPSVVDSVPKSDDDSSAQDTYFHINLHTITSNAGKYKPKANPTTYSTWPSGLAQTTEFTYGWDASVIIPVAVKRGADYQTEDYNPYPTRPRIISQIGLADNTSSTFSFTGVPVHLSYEIDPSNGHPEYDDPDDSGDNSDGPSLTAGSRTVTITDAKSKTRTFAYSDSELIDGQEIENLLQADGHLRPPYILVAWKQCVVTHPGGGTETATFDLTAGLADQLVTDYSGNETSYTYDDTFKFTDAQPSFLVDTNLKNALDSISLLSGHYTDPTQEISGSGAAQVTKEFTYTTSGRFMKTIDIRDATNAVVRSTEYVVAAGTGNRTKETVTDGVTTVVKDYAYDTIFKAFVTKETVNGAIHNDGSFDDLVTDNTPDTYGNLATSTVDGLVTAHLYDANGNRTQTTDPNSNVTGFEYDDLNRLVKVTLPAAGTGVGYTRTGWSPAHKKIWEQDANGHFTFYEYDKRNRLTATIRDMTDHLDVFSSPASTDIVTSAEYDGVGNVIHQWDARGHQTDFSYDNLHRKTGSTFDPGGSGHLNLTTTYGYSGSNSGSNAFSGSGFKPITITDPRGFTTTFAYDSRYRPIAVYKKIDSGPHYQASATKYDSFGNTVRTWSWRTPTTTLTLPAESGAIGTATTYDCLDRPKQVVDGIHGASDDSLATTTVNNYTATSLWHTTKTDGSGTGSMVRHTETDFDAAGRPVAIWNADASTGLIDRTQDSDPVAGSGATLMEYDYNGNKLRVRDTLGNYTRTSYDARNRVKAVAVNAVDKNPGNPDSPGSDDDVTKTDYDQNGNVRYVTDPRGNISETVYDFANRPIERITPVVDIYGTSAASLHTFTDYDTNGNAIQVTDPAGAWTRNLYDNANRLVATSVNPTTGHPNAPPASGAGGAGDIIVRNEYDGGGNLTKVTDGGGSATAFAYDGLGRKLSTKWDDQDASRRKTDHITEYDAMVATQVTDARGQVIISHYDNRNRLTGIECVSATSQSRTLILDMAGRTVKILHGGHNLAASTAVTADLRNVGHAYDMLDRVTQENSVGCAHGYDWDKQGNRTKVTYSTGRVIISSYDYRNRLQAMDENAAGSGTTRETIYYYDRNSNVLSINHPNDTNEYTSYDELNRQTLRETYQGLTTLLSDYALHYDATSSLRYSVDRVDVAGSLSGTPVPNRTVLNTYDKTSRLLTETATDAGKAVTTTYAYDDANNRTSKAVATTIGGSTSTESNSYTYGNTTNGLNSNQLYQWVKTGVSTATYGYDNNGNRSSQTTVTGGVTSLDQYTYDYFNHLVQIVQTPDTGSSGSFKTHNYSYDHRTRRVIRSEEPTVGAGASSTKVSYSGGTSVLEYSGASYATLDVEYVRGSDWGGGVGGILYTSRSTTLSWAHYNGRGDVVSRVDDSGALTYAASYEAFGTRPAEAGTNPDRQRGNTKEEDALTGLLNEGQRFRDLATGMFLTRDPAGFVDGPNVYTYVRQNPWSAFDPEGLAGELAAESRIAIAGPQGWLIAGLTALIVHYYAPAVNKELQRGVAIAQGHMAAMRDQQELDAYRADHNGQDPPPGVMGNSIYRTGPPSKTAPQSGVSGSARETAKASNKAGATAPTVAQSSASEEKPATEAEAPKPEEKADAAESGKPKVKAKDRRAQQQAEAKERKHGDSDYEEAAPEDYAKWKAKELEKAEGKDARRAAHDKKRDGIDRTKRQLDKDYEE